MQILAVLLTRTVASVLSIKDVREAVHSPFVTSNNTLFIKPDGPLNFLYGYTYYKERLAHRMRYFSPAFRINYTLTKSENSGDDRFEINNNKDGINTFKGDVKTSEYLASYYKAFKEMFNVVNNEVNIHTARKSSLFMFLTEKLDETTRLRLLATMIVLAGGVDVPLKFENKHISINESKITVPVLTCKQGNAIPFLDIEMYEVFKRPRVENQDGSFTEENEVLHKLKEMMDIVKFFIGCGGKNTEGLSVLNLAFNETPRFLIHNYVFELIETLSDARQLFSAVKELLEYTGNGEDSKAWNLFFTKDSEEVDKYEPAYEMYQAIAKLIFEMGFPFSISNQPPSNEVVKGYNRKTGEEITSSNMNFSDCCDITIYSLLCCLLYNPAERRYSLNHLGDRNFTPSGDLSAFFENVCIKPAETTNHNLHQQWTHVVQDLVLSEGELRGGEESGSNTIVYRKEEDGVHAEIKTELLNVLKIVAKITGVPKERMIELNRINSMVKDVGASWDDVRQSVEAFTTQLIQDISIMPVEVSFEGLRLTMSNNEFRGVYGMINLKFTSADDDGVLDKHHAIQFSFNSGHASAVISNDPKTESEAKNALNDLIAKCNCIDGSLGKRVVMYGNKFFKKVKFESVPSEKVKEIEEASNELERYSAIIRVLMDYSFKTMDDKLYFIDLFGPYLERMTTTNANAEGEVTDTPQNNGVPVQNPQDNALVQKLSNTGAIKQIQLEASDPVVQLITNIMGSVPLGDKATQELFIQIFGFCNGEYRRLFPNFRGGSFNILPEFTDLEKGEKSTYDIQLLWNVEQKTMPNALFRIFGPLRATHKENFIEKLCDKSNLTVFYISMLKNFTLTKNVSGIEAVKKDLKIRDGLIEPGPDVFFRAAAWFSASMDSTYCEGIEILCNNWERIHGKDNVLSVLFHVKSRNWFTWYIRTPNDFLNSFYENEHNERILMEMCCHFSHDSQHFDMAFSLLILSPHSRTLFEVLYTSLGNIIENEFNYVLGMEKSGYPTELKLFVSAMKYLDSLYRFVEDVDIYRKRAMERLMYLFCESYRSFDKSFDVMYDQLNKIREPLRKNRDKLNIQSNFARLNKFLDEVCNSQDPQRKLLEVIKLAEKACRGINISGNFEETREFDKEACEKLSIQEKLDKIKEIFKEICDKLEAEGELDMLTRAYFKIFNEFRKSERR